MKNYYILIFALEGVGIGALLYLVLRSAVRHFFDVHTLIPQFPHVGIVANVVGLAVVLPLVVLVTIAGVRSLGLDKV
ncbi:hypothetical protein [Natrinema versiforme]|uniref:Uncharacterized protein n=1 Tax=Natrinema versiforme JCM 10478 TaxID=1227496 RepID=L9Y369_9EURY|nr:hypothetical protein [Natrinema versiforme]ELY68504.1 hypothetical protein C489_07375 [Natrinema versiforme JCM 10478]